MRRGERKRGETPIWKGLRLPRSVRAGKPHTTPKGAKGYDRRAARAQLRRFLETEAAN